MKQKTFAIFSAAVFIIFLTSCDEFNFGALIGYPSENPEDFTISWTKHPVASGFIQAYWVSAADIDGDTDPDIVATAYGGGEIAWWENTDGQGTFGSKKTITSSFATALLVDTARINNDADIDVVATGYTNNRISWLENADGQGTTWSPMPDIIGTHTMAYGLCLADINGDSNIDVVGTDQDNVTPNVAWWANDGTGSFGAKQDIDTVMIYPISVFAADLDGDSDLDLVAAATSDVIAYWINTDGVGSFGARQEIDTNFDFANSVCAADLDGDSDNDILATAYNINTVAWWENTDGAGSFGIRQIIDNGFTGVRYACTADVDDDGDIDVLGTALTADIVAWWENTDGTGTFGSRQVIDNSFDGANCLCVADLDGDGDLDVIGAARNGNQVAWWEQVRTPLP